MELISIVVDWVLRITGLGSIIIILINLCIRNCEYLENVRIIANPTSEELNGCKIYNEYSDNDNAVETTLFMPVSCKVKDLKLRSVEIKNRGKIKKGKVIKKFKNMEPYHAVLFNITRGCAFPLYLFEWKIDYGYKAYVYISSNGFNGNTDEKIIKYIKGPICKIRKMLLIK